jgi:hypothetical protein
MSVVDGQRTLAFIILTFLLIKELIRGPSSDLLLQEGSVFNARSNRPFWLHYASSLSRPIDYSPPSFC